MHADPDELAALVTAATRRGGLYATHMRNEGAGLFAALAESIATVRAAARCRRRGGPRLQVSHLKCGARAVWGRAGEAIAMLEAARAEGLDVAADQYPYTAAATTLATILPPSLLGLGVEECVAALGDHEVRDRVIAEMERGISGWENVAADPGWAGIRISFAPSHPDWAGRSLAELGAELDADPADLAFDALIDDRLDVAVVIECMDEADVETILAVPWIGGLHRRQARRPGHPILDAGRPHPRTYGSTARVLGTYVRERGTLDARDGDRQADRGVRGATRPARPGRAPRGRLRRPRRLRPDDRRRRRDVRAPVASTRPGSSMSSSTDGWPSWPASRPASEPGACCDGPDEAGHRPTPRRHACDRGAGRRAAAGRPAAVHAPPLAAGARLAGRDPSGTWRRRHGAGHAVRADRRRAACRRVPRRTRAVGPPPSAPDRPTCVRELAARGGARDGGSIRLEGRVVPIRVVPAVLGARRSTVARFDDELVIHRADRDRAAGRERHRGVAARPRPRSGSTRPSRTTPRRSA